MSDKTKFTVRPFSRPARPDLKDALRVNLSATALLTLKLRAGDQCLLQKDEAAERPAIAWQAVERIQDTVVQISKALQDLYGLQLGDKISVLNSQGAVRDAGAVEIREVILNDTSAPSLDDQIPEGDRPHWEWLLHDPLSKAEILICGLRLDSVQARGQKRSFIISHIDGADPSCSSPICKVTPTTVISIRRRGDQLPIDQSSESIEWLEISDSRIGGLKRQLEQINLLLRRFEPEFQHLTRTYNYQPSQGLLVYGSKGTGKSLLIDELSACSWSNVIKWSTISSTGTDLGEQVQNIFSGALRRQPCLVVIEQLEALASKRGTLEGSSNLNFSPILRKGFELIRNHAVLVVAEVRHPNDIDDNLRAQTVFGIEIELPVPAANGRLEILRRIRGSASQPSEEILTDVAGRTHGYVGADLCALYQRIIESAAHRALEFRKTDEHRQDGVALNGAFKGSSSPSTSDSGPPLKILSTDVTTALSLIRPTAMQEIFLENPNIRWSDIGGQHLTKLRLQRAISRPLRNATTMARLNLRSNSGVLLYGPPGCSKTLLVKALAAEAGLNFLAVKGAELVSMYVGESERAVREVFRKARAASPSVIFFDEFDSIASVRASGGATNSSSNGGNLNILTTLLNEMDGFEQLRDVLIIAATNRPEILDPALLRPGRLDHLVYVGPPDLEARKEILHIWLGKSDAAADVDVDVLARMTDGYSGAEIVSICETAGGFAMDEEEEVEGRERGMEGDGEGLEAKIGMAHLRMAVGEVRRGITEEVVRRYVDWGAGRGSTRTATRSAMHEHLTDIKGETDDPSWLTSF
jgi:AAA family ATPase